MASRSTLEQWRMLRAVVDHGGFAQAAAAIHKSQSSINHAVHKLQGQLGLPLLEVVGRKAVLTDAGRLMLRHADQLLQQATRLEDIAGSLTDGIEAEIHLAVDEIFPPACLADALAELAREFPHTRVELIESVLSGGPELLVAGEADLLIANDVPAGFLGEPILTTDFVAVAHPDHPLHQLPRALNLQDLAQHRQIVVRDSARGQRTDSGWLGAEQRWTVTHLATSIEMVTRGMGFAWLPKTRIDDLLANDALRPLALKQGATRSVTLFVTFVDSDRAGPATSRLAALLRASLP